MSLPNLLAQYFNEEELRTLCFILYIDYGDLPGTGKVAKARELVMYLQRRQRLDELIALCLQERPNIHWAELLLDKGETNTSCNTTFSHEVKTEPKPTAQDKIKNSITDKIITWRSINQTLLFLSILIILIIFHNYLPAISSYFLDTIALMVFIFRLKTVSEKKNSPFFCLAY